MPSGSVQLQTIDYINEIGFLPLLKNEIPRIFSGRENGAWTPAVRGSRKRSLDVGELSLQENMILSMENSLIKRRDSYQKSGCLCSQITEGTAMILMPYMKTERHHINIK